MQSLDIGQHLFNIASLFTYLNHLGPPYFDYRLFKIIKGQSKSLVHLISSRFIKSCFSSYLARKIPVMTIVVSVHFGSHSVTLLLSHQCECMIRRNVMSIFVQWITTCLPSYPVWSTLYVLKSSWSYWVFWEGLNFTVIISLLQFDMLSCFWRKPCVSCMCKWSM